jgi:hypothetical protein
MKPNLRIIEGNAAARTTDPVDSRIRAFLAGNNDGSELLAALYGHVGRETIPDSLRFVASPDRECVA